jgi:hypothetical protein
MVEPGGCLRVEKRTWPDSHRVNDHKIVTWITNRWRPQLTTTDSPVMLITRNSRPDRDCGELWYVNLIRTEAPVFPQLHYTVAAK